MVLVVDWWLLALPLVLFFLLALLPLTLEVYYRRRGQDDHLTLTMRLWFGINYRLTLPVLNLTNFRLFSSKLKLRAGFKAPSSGRPVREKKRLVIPDPLTMYRLLSRYYRLGKKLWPALTYLAGRVELHYLEWHTLIGLSDAAYTGMAVGGLWSVKGLVLSILYRICKKTKTRPEVTVVPHFTGPAFGLLLHCIFTVRIGHIMVTVIRMVFVLILSKFLYRFRSLFYSKTPKRGEV